MVSVHRAPNLLRCRTLEVPKYICGPGRLAYPAPCKRLQCCSLSPLMHFNPLNSVHRALKLLRCRAFEVLKYICRPGRLAYPVPCKRLQCRAPNLLRCRALEVPKYIRGPGRLAYPAPFKRLQCCSLSPLMHFNTLNGHFNCV